MSKEFIPFKGHFLIKTFDENNNLLDSWEDDNMIMGDASITMSEIFAGTLAGGGSLINRFSLGTRGHLGTNLLSPRTITSGFVNTRTKMFSDPIAVIQNNSIIPVLQIGDCYHITNATVPGYYEYNGVAVQNNYTLSQAIIDSAVEWTFISATAPYLYDINFNMPGTAINNVVGDPAVPITETDYPVTGAISNVTVLRSGTSVTFFIDIAKNVANSQNATDSAFTEAALYSQNGRIFSLKTFKAKIKDPTVSIRIEWMITF